MFHLNEKRKTLLFASIHRNSRVHKFWNTFKKFIPRCSNEIFTERRYHRGKMDNFWFSDAGSNVGTKARRNYIASERKLSSWNVGLVGVSSSRVTKCPAKFLKDEKTSLPTRRNPRGQTREGHEIMWNYFFVAALNAKASACLPEISNRANITSCSRFFPLPLLSIGCSSAKNTFTSLNSKILSDDIL